METTCNKPSSKDYINELVNGISTRVNCDDFTAIEMLMDNKHKIEQWFIDGHVTNITNIVNDLARHKVSTVN